MERKKDILEKLQPMAVLKAMTDAAIRAVPQTVLIESYIPIRYFPFRVGRESRIKIVEGRVERIERPKIDNSDPTNDLYLIDDGHLLNISREHFQIEESDGDFYLYDRGSACGTIVENQGVGGGDNDGTIKLKDGDTIIVGTRQSPYIFQFIDLSVQKNQEPEEEEA